jgi:hypothetical protein
MTTAKKIIALVADASAVTLTGGYAMYRNTPRKLFEPARIVGERRNASGRVTFLEAHYKDASVIEFRYNAQRGASWRAR